MKKIRIALDWTANTNHTGFFVAKAKGFYKDLNIDVEIITPNIDDYTTTPAKKVELEEVDFALCPFESVISYRTKKKSFPAVAVAALLREDLSAIACLKDLGIASPKDLDGKTYASYQARYEDEIVRQMVKNDGGNGNLKIVYPEKLGIWSTIFNRKTDATWIFLNWEGLQAKTEDVSLSTFAMKDYGVPYGYSPIIFANANNLKDMERPCSDFLKATKQGYLFAKSNPKEAITYLRPHISESDKNIDLLESQQYTGKYYGDGRTWGTMNSKKITEYLVWLNEKGLEKKKLNVDSLLVKGLF